MTDKGKIMWKNKKAMIFDLDGTLVDSMWMWYDIDVEYLARFNIAVPKGLQADIEGKSFSETAIYFKERFNIPDSIEKIKSDWNQMAWDKYTNEVPMKEGATEFIRECRKRGILLGIATSNSRELVENIIAVHGMKDDFACIMTGCDVKYGKPSPDIYLAVAEALNVAPCDCLVFEDIVPGIMAGRHAGMEVCAIEDEYSLYQTDEKASLADYYIKDYRELLR